MKAPVRVELELEDGIAKTPKMIAPCLWREAVKPFVMGLGDWQEDSEREDKRFDTLQFTCDKGWWPACHGQTLFNKQERFSSSIKAAVKELWESEAKAGITEA